MAWWWNDEKIWIVQWINLSTFCREVIKTKNWLILELTLSEPSLFTYKYSPTILPLMTSLILKTDFTIQTIDLTPNGSIDIVGDICKKYHSSYVLTFPLSKTSSYVFLSMNDSDKTIRNTIVHNIIPNNRTNARYIQLANGDFYMIKIVNNVLCTISVDEFQTFYKRCTMELNYQPMYAMCLVS